MISGNLQRRICAALVVAVLAVSCSGGSNQSAGAGSNAPVLDPRQTAQKARVYYNQLANDMIQELSSWPRQNPYMSQSAVTRQSAFQARLAAAGLSLKSSRYGSFCGEKNPAGLSMIARVDETEKEAFDRRFNNIQTVRRAGQPADAIDQLCFAHDVCYQAIGKDSDACDFPMVLSLMHLARALEQSAGRTERACANLAWDLTLAYLLKPRSGTTDDQANRAVRTYALYQSIQTDTPGFPASKLSEQNRHGYPASGSTCQMPAAAGNDAITLFTEFVNVRALQDAFRRDLSARQLAATPRYYDALVDPGAEFTICTVPPGGGSNHCWQSDWELVTQDWSGVRRKIATESEALLSIVAQGPAPVVASAGRVASAAQPSASSALFANP